MGKITEYISNEFGKICICYDKNTKVNFDKQYTLMQRNYIIALHLVVVFVLFWYIKINKNI